MKIIAMVCLILYIKQPIYLKIHFLKELLRILRVDFYNDSTD